MTIKIFSLGKFEFHNYYVLEKKQEFFTGFRQFLEDLGLGRKDSTYEIYSFGRPEDGMGEPITTKEEEIKFYIDKHFYFENKEYFIDVVFGNDRIFLMIHSKHDKEKEISEKIQKFC